MKRMLYIITMGVLFIAGCDTHQWPDLPEFVKFNLRLSYETDITEWYHTYDGISAIEETIGDTYDNTLGYGNIRYIIRAYPYLDEERIAQEHTHEFVFTKKISEGYNNDLSLELPDGKYKILVWSELQEYENDAFFYNTDNFSEITLQGDHKGNTDYRDAFRGSGEISLVADIVERIPDTLDVTMQRPLAKYEFITTDLTKFINKEIEYLTKAATVKGEAPPTKVNTDEYNVVVYFSGYMPSAYNLKADKPADAKMGVLFNSKLKILNEDEASLGFDYVFVSDKKSAVTIQLGLYDKEERQIALTEPINVPLQRNCHTILKSSFLMQEASGGIAINPEFDGNHNIVIQ